MIPLGILISAGGGGGEEPDETVWYVSNSGNSGGGHSVGNPIDPVSFVSAPVQANDIVNFNRGEVYDFGDYTIPVNGLTIGAYGTGAEPILNGSTDYSLATWTSEGSGIYSTPVSTAVKWVFINGLAARLGESPYIPITSAPSGTTRGALTATLNAYNSVNTLVGTKLRVKEFNFRMSFEMNISAYNSGTGVITTTETFSGAAVNMPFKLYGALQFLTTNGDWWWDDATDKLYVKAAATPAGTDIRVTFADNAFFADGKDDLTISGLEFKHYYRAAIEAVHCDNLNINDFSIHDVRTNGLWIYGNSTGLVVDNFSMTRIGCHAIYTGAIQGPTFTNFTISEIGSQDNMSWPIDTRFRKHCGVGIAVSDEPTETLKQPGNVTVQDFLIHDVGGQGIGPYGDNWLIERGEIYNFAEKWEDVGGIHSFYSDALGVGLSCKDGVIRDVIVHDGVGNHEGIANYTLPTLVAGVYLDAGSETWELDNVTAYNNPFVGLFVNWDTFGQNFHDCVLYNNAVAQIEFTERPNAGESPHFLRNWGNQVNNCVFLMNFGQHAIATTSLSTGASSSYNPYASGGGADNNLYIYPHQTATWFRHGTTSIHTSFTDINLGAWRTRNSTDAASTQKTAWLQEILSTFGEDTIVFRPNPTAAPVTETLITGFYRDAADTNINSFDVPAYSAGYALIRPDYYYLMDDFPNANGTSMASKAAFIGPNANVISGVHTVQNGVMTTSTTGNVSWNVGSPDLVYEIVATTVTAASQTMRIDVRLQDNTASANNRIIIDFPSGSGTIRFREFFANATAVQTLTESFTIASSTSYRLVIIANGANIKVYVSGVLYFDVTVQLLTGNWINISGEVNRWSQFITAYKLTP